jgi:hypothetical protein
LRVNADLRSTVHYFALPHTKGKVVLLQNSETL